MQDLTRALSAQTLGGRRGVNARALYALHGAV
jgi:hypothetical protein